jgi:Protein of unknown function (DUF1573)
MSDDFGTVSVGRGDRAREIEALRGKYRVHRESLQKLAADAPTDHLATEYQRLLSEIETALTKLDELDARGPTGSGSVPVPPPRARTSAGDIPLATPPRSGTTDPNADATGGSPNPASRVAIIVLAGLIVLGAIVWLIWRGSERHGATTTTAVEGPSTIAPAETAAPSTAATSSSATPTTTATAALLRITPVIADYGTIQKGTRAVRQFEVVNNGSKTVTLQVSRSACRCLYYDYHDKIAAKKKETITVTIDGAKAKEGPLRENLTVMAKENHSITAEMAVQATIK